MLSANVRTPGALEAPPGPWPGSLDPSLYVPLPSDQGGRRVRLPDVAPLQSHQSLTVPQRDIGNAAVVPLKVMARGKVYPSAGGGQWHGPQAMPDVSKALRHEPEGTQGLVGFFLYNSAASPDTAVPPAWAI